MKTAQKYCRFSHDNNHLTRSQTTMTATQHFRHISISVVCDLMNDLETSSRTTLPRKKFWNRYVYCVCCYKSRDSVTFTFGLRLLSLVHKALIGQAPDYITNLFALVTNIPSRSSLQRRPLSAKNRAANWRPYILCRRTSCMESPTDRTETHAVVDSNIQAPSEVFSFSHRVLIM